MELNSRKHQLEEEKHGFEKIHEQMNNKPGEHQSQMTQT